MITGSRFWTDETAMRDAFSCIQSPTPVVLIHGCCSGADMMADRIAREYGWEVRRYPADWTGPCQPECPPGHRIHSGRRDYCPDAGHRRNRAMVDSKPNVVYAFPTEQSKGTWSAVRLAREADITCVISWSRSDTMSLSIGSGGAAHDDRA